MQAFSFRQIDNLKTNYNWKKEEKHNEKMDKKYGNYTLEDDEMKFIWGIIGTGELTENMPNLYTMNDIEITFNKKEKKYHLGIETVYLFKTHDDECHFLQDCLFAFTKFMDDNGFSKNQPYNLFMSRPDISMEAESIEALYTNFKIFVDGFSLQKQWVQN